MSRPQFEGDREAPNRSTRHKGGRTDADRIRALEVQAAELAKPVRGILVPNATVGTDKTQTTTGNSWVFQYGTNLFKKGDYWENATLTNYAGVDWVEIDYAGYYVFEMQFVGSFPSSSNIGWGISTKTLSDAGYVYRDAHNHEKPYTSTTDYKTRSFQMYCPAGELVSPTIYFSGVTGTVTFYNQVQTKCHFSFCRIGL